MSVKASNWAWNQPLKPTPKLVLMRLADFAGQDGKCYASYSRLIQDVGVSKNTIRKSLDELIEQGFITKIRNVRQNMGYATSSFILNMETQDVVPPRSEIDQGGSSETDQGLGQTVDQGKELTLKQKKRKKEKKNLRPHQISIQKHDKKWISAARTFSDEPYFGTVKTHRDECRCLFCSTNRCWHIIHDNLKIKAGS